MRNAECGVTANGNGNRNGNGNGNRNGNGNGNRNGNGNGNGNRQPATGSGKRRGAFRAGCVSSRVRSGAGAALASPHCFRNFSRHAGWY